MILMTTESPIWCDRESKKMSSVETIQMSIPIDRLVEVAAVLAKAPVSLGEAKLDSEEWGDELVEKLYEISTERARAFLDYLADRPGEVVGAGELARDHSWDEPQLWGVHGSITKNCINKLGRKRGPFVEGWSQDTRRPTYRMDDHTAEVIRQARAS